MVEVIDLAAGEAAVTTVNGGCVFLDGVQTVEGLGEGASHGFQLLELVASEEVAVRQAS
jgi:hypothetical protein